MSLHISYHIGHVLTPHPHPRRCDPDPQLWHRRCKQTNRRRAFRFRSQHDTLEKHSSFSWIVSVWILGLLLLVKGWLMRADSLLLSPPVFRSSRVTWLVRGISPAGHRGQWGLSAEELQQSSGSHSSMEVVFRRFFPTDPLSALCLSLPPSNYLRFLFPRGGLYSAAFSLGDSHRLVLQHSSEELNSPSL